MGRLVGEEPMTPKQKAFVKKLCQPEPFFPTPAERAMLAIFLRNKWLRYHADGSVELTMRGANAYLET